MRANPWLRRACHPLFSYAGELARRMYGHERGGIVSGEIRAGKAPGGTEARGEEEARGERRGWVVAEGDGPRSSRGGATGWTAPSGRVILGFCVTLGTFGREESAILRRSCIVACGSGREVTQRHRERGRTCLLREGARGIPGFAGCGGCLGRGELPTFGGRWTPVAVVLGRLCAMRGRGALRGGKRTLRGGLRRRWASTPTLHGYFATLLYRCLWKGEGGYATTQERGRTRLMRKGERGIPEFAGCGGCLGLRWLLMRWTEDGGRAAGLVRFWVARGQGALQDEKGRSAASGGGGGRRTPTLRDSAAKVRTTPRSPLEKRDGLAGVVRTLPYCRPHMFAERRPGRVSRDAR